MDNYRATGTFPLQITSDLGILKLEYVLQFDRSAWSASPRWPYIEINADQVAHRIRGLAQFPVFPTSAHLWQNIRPEELGARLLGGLFGGGTNAGMDPRGRHLVEGKANAKSNIVVRWNPPLAVGGSPWCASGTHFIYVDGENLFQYKYAELITHNGMSRPSSNHFDFTELSDLRDRYYIDYFHRPQDETIRELGALSSLLDKLFEQNTLSLIAAEAYHARASVGSTSVDYVAPLLTKYGRATHDATGQPKVEISFALLHYEKAIAEFNSVKSCARDGKTDEAFVHGVYCVVAAAACIEAIANKLVYLQTGAHPNHNDRRVPLAKLNDSASALAERSGQTYAPLTAGQPAYDALDQLRLLRNSFMHAKELEADIDPQSLTSAVVSQVNETACRNFLSQLRLAMDQVYTQLPNHPAPIVTKTNHRWLGELEVP